MLTKFGKLLTLRYEHDHIKAEVDPLGEAGKLLAETTIEKQKEHIGRVLVDERRRVVVFLDDLDRLDRREIQAVVRLVKLCGDFNHVDYVLAFDRDVVASAIGGHYGAGAAVDGYDYLQKLVQVSLELPIPDQTVLGRICKEGVLGALKNAQGGTSDAVVGSAFPIDAGALADLKATLEKRFGRKLNLSVEVQPELIGGIRVVVGDEVLDTSVRARLEQMKVALTA